MQIVAMTAKIKKKVSDQLAGAVISGLSPAIDFEKWMRQLLAPAQTGAIGCSPDGINRLVLKQKKRIGCFREGVFAADDFFLLRKCSRKSDSA